MNRDREFVTSQQLNTICSPAAPESPVPSVFSKDFPREHKHVGVRVWGLWELFKIPSLDAEIKETAEKTNKGGRGIKSPCLLRKQETVGGRVGGWCWPAPLFGFGSLQWAGL